MPQWAATLTPDQVTTVIRRYNQLHGANFRTDAAGVSQFYGSVPGNDPTLRSILDNEIDPYRVSGAASANTDIGISLGAQPRQVSRERPITENRALTDTALATNATSAPYLNELLSVAQKYAVPWQILWGLIQHESGWRSDVEANGDRGLAQINRTWHPEVSDSQAFDPHFAIQWAARNIAEAYGTYGDWSLAVLHHNNPKAAEYRSRGQIAPGREQLDAAYIGAVMNTAVSLGLPADFASGEGIAAAGGGNAFPTPDPVTLEAQAKQYLQSLFFRPPEPGEVEGLMQFARGLFTTANAQGTAALAAGAPAAGAGYFHPAPGGRRTGGYGDDRGDHAHQGVDWSVPEGTPVVATVGGVVQHRSDPEGYGTYAILRGDDGNEYVYAHLNEILIGDGSRVEAGQPVAKSGNTGRSTGPHLHFEVRTPNGSGPRGQVDPEAFLQGSAEVATDEEVQSGALASEFDTIDWQQRLLARLRDSEEYKSLYGNMPSYLNEQQYSQQFLDVGQSLYGTAPDEGAIREGMRSNSTATTAGYLAARPGAAQNPTFRQRLFQVAGSLNRML